MLGVSCAFGLERNEEGVPAACDEMKLEESKWYSVILLVADNFEVFFEIMGRNYWKLHSFDQSGQILFCGILISVVTKGRDS